MALFPLGLLVLILQSILRPVWGNSPQIFVTTSLVNFDARIVEGWSGGGGDLWTISNDSNYPFSNRSFGSADRWTLKGTQTFGSGYPYGNVDNSTIAGRPFPYGLWPLYWGNNTMGSDEYGPALDGVRPGGQLVTIPLKVQGQYYNVTENEVYYMIGDRDSALFMMISLVTSCHVAPAWPSKFDPTSPNSTVMISNVIQYYRASSFALAFRGYTNQNAIGNTNTQSTTHTPLTDVVLSSEFRKCLDDVIVNALPIMNWPPAPETTLGTTLGIIFGIFGIPILVGICSIVILIVSCIRSARWKAKHAKSEAARLKASNSAARTAALAYEHYP